MSEKIRWCETKPRPCDCKGTCATKKGEKGKKKSKDEFKINI